MRIVRKFIKLTKFTYPHGTENQLKNHLPQGYKEDGHGNFYLKIGDKPTTMFTCHLDTVSSKRERVNHVFSGKYVGTDGNTTLGADDKAGMVVLLSLIEKQIPGLYYFFIGEEVGCIGSGRAAGDWLETEFSDYITKCVSFDRRGTTSVITEQVYGQCASDEFAIELSKRLNSVNDDFKFSPDPTGILTDSVCFVDMIPECTNISVGYYNEHSGSEKQDLDFLKNLCKAVCEIDWETLPVVRDPLFDYYGDLDEMDDFDLDDSDSKWSEDYYSYFKIGDDVKKMYISKSQISKERTIIYNWLFSTGNYPGFKGIIWNGNRLKIESSRGVEFAGDRVDLVGMMPELSSVYTKDLSNSIPIGANIHIL